MKPNGSVSAEWAKGPSFGLEKTLFYREVTFLINNNLFRECFSNFRMIRLNSTTVSKTPMLKKYFNSGEKCFPAFQRFRIN